MEMRKFHFTPNSVIKKLDAHLIRGDSLVVQRVDVLREINQIAGDLGGYVPCGEIDPTDPLIIHASDMRAQREGSMRANDFNADLGATCLMLRSVQKPDTPNWYTIPSDFALALIGSVMPNLILEKLTLPYAAIFLELPADFIFYSGHDDNSPLAVRSVGVSLESTSESTHLIFLGYNYRPHENDPQRSVFYLRITCRHGQGLTEGKFDDDDDDGDDPYDDRVELRDSSGSMNRIGMKGLYRLLIGTTVFIGQGEGVERKVSNPSKPAKGKKIWGARAPSPDREALNLLNANTWIVGTKVKLHPEVREAIRRGDISENPTSRKRGRTVVAGHYHRYRHGPRDNWHYETHWIWPFVRGEGEGPVLGHTYDA